MTRERIFPAGRWGWLKTAALAVLLTMPRVAALACGIAEPPCRVSSGSFHAVGPAWRAGGPLRPAIVHFHGAGGSGQGVLDERAMVAPALEAGFVFIAPNGEARPANGRSGWRFRQQDTEGRDELAFLREVLEAAGPRFHIDRRRVLLTGFSVGGSLVWYLACRAPADFAAYAPVAGGFWEPQPRTCAGPVRMLHMHGWMDRTVPLEGRPLRNGRLRQGDIFEGLQTWRRVNGCDAARPDTSSAAGRFWRRSWTSCASGMGLNLVIHPDGHGVPDEWMPMAIGWFAQQFPRVQAGR